MLNLITIFIVTAVAFGLVIFLMSVGVMLGRREIKGSCGGLGSSQSEDGASSCSLCSSQESAACGDLRREPGPGQPGGSGADCGGTGPEKCELDCQVEGCSEEQIEACKH